MIAVNNIAGGLQINGENELGREVEFAAFESPGDNVFQLHFTRTASAERARPIHCSNLGFLRKGLRDLPMFSVWIAEANIMTIFNLGSICGSLLFGWARAPN